MADLAQEEVQQRIVAARMLRGISQRELDQLAAADGYGKTEMSRVERGELAFRPGKHIEPLCRYLDVPRWWFTAGTIKLPDQIGDDAIGQLAADLSQVGAGVSEFRVWAERAVDRIIQDRTEAIARVDQRLSVLESRTKDIAGQVDVLASHSETRAREDAVRIAREAAQRQRDTSSQTRASRRSQGDPGTQQ